MFIIPAWNERPNIAGVVADIRSEFTSARIVVVDDGSTDGTGDAARRAGAEVVSLTCNFGIGAAVQTGMKLAAEQGVPIALQFDGDGQHRADQVRALIAPILAGRADVTIGSRFLDGSHHPSLGRRAGVAILRLVNSVVIRSHVTDCTSGFRAYNVRAIRLIANQYAHDYPEPEAIGLLARNGFRVEEVPVAMNERKSGRSSITVIRAMYYMVKVSLAILVTSTRKQEEPIHEPTNPTPRNCE